MTTLKGKTILVVGGSSGIGFAVAKLALLSDASRVIIASSSRPKVDAALERLVAFFPSPEQNGVRTRVSGETVDAKKAAEVRALVAKVGELDHLVWTSGDSLVDDFLNTDLEAHKDLFDVRFWGALEAARAAKFKTGGSIILTLGEAVKKPFKKGVTLVSGMSGAVDAAVRGLAIDLAPLRVNAVSPGSVKTELWDTFNLSEAEKEGIYAALSMKLPVGHVAVPEEIAEAYIFLMKCGYITGQRIDVDGGVELV